MPGADTVTKRNDVSVKINADVYRMVRTIAAWNGVSVADYLSEIAKPTARRDMAKMSKESSKEGKEEAE